LRVSRALLGLAIAACAAVGVRADAVDPTVIIRRVDPKPVVITSPNQIFDLFANTQQNIFAFQNATGMTLTSLTLDLFGQNVSLLFSCGSFAGGDIFANCTSTQGSQGDYLINFSGVGNGFTGIEAATCTIDDKESATACTRPSTTTVTTNWYARAVFIRWNLTAFLMVPSSAVLAVLRRPSQRPRC
jgi:hypothetical protein